VRCSEDWHRGDAAATPARRKSFADLPSPVSEQRQDFRRLVAVLVGDERDARGVAPRINLDSDRPNIAPDAVL
jgi:hypothetical protein